MINKITIDSCGNKMTTLHFTTKEWVTFGAFSIFVIALTAILSAGIMYVVLLMARKVFMG